MPRGSRLLLPLIVAALSAHGQYLETTIPVGDTPTYVLWNPASNKVYCANTQDHNVTIIDGETNQVIAVVEVGEYPFRLAWNSRENKVYCVCSEDNKVAVIDGVGDTLLRMPRVRDWPYSMAYSATTNKLYVACDDNDRVAVLDAGPDTIIKHIDIRGAGRLLWHPVSDRVFCYTNADADTIKVIDCVTDEIVVRMPLSTAGYPLGDWCWNPVSNLVYLPSRYVIYVLTPEGDSVVAEVPVYASQLCAAPFPNKLYALGDGWVHVIDGATHVVSESLRVGGFELLCDTVKGKAYCVDLHQEKVHILDACADTLIDSIPLGRYPLGLCWNRTNSRVYIADCMDDVVYVIRDTTSGIAEEPERAKPTYPAATLTRGRLRVAEQGRLYDTGGRQVGLLRRGENDVRHLAPGVYTAHLVTGALSRVVKIR